MRAKWSSTNAQSYGNTYAFGITDTQFYADTYSYTQSNTKATSDSTRAPDAAIIGTVTSYNSYKVANTGNHELTPIKINSGATCKSPAFAKGLGMAGCEFTP